MQSAISPACDFAFLVDRVRDLSNQLRGLALNCVGNEVGLWAAFKDRENPMNAPLPDNLPEFWNGIIRLILDWPLLGDDSDILPGEEVSVQEFRMALKQLLTKPKDFNAKRLNGEDFYRPYQTFFQKIKKSLKGDSEIERKQILEVIDTAPIDLVLNLFSELHECPVSRMTETQKLFI